VTSIWKRSVWRAFFGTICGLGRHSSGPKPSSRSEGHDLRVADWAAQLWLEGWAPRLVLSGGLGYYTSKIWCEPEAHKFQRIALEKGVRADAIFIEDQSTNSGENVAFTRALLQREGILLRRAICVQKPYMERRVLLTLTKQWPGCEFQLASPPIPFERYPREDVIELGNLIHALVGQVDRIERYPALGFTDSVAVPDEVLTTKRRLVERGFTRLLVTP
jgi:uncharacterized SAM-binding protein YcdF (DUF218 family)